MVRNYNHNFLEIIQRYNLQTIKFIEVGAYDGVSGDPLHRFIKQYNWSGILVEPYFPAFEQLVQNYSDQKNLVFENVAIHPVLKTSNLYISKKRSNNSLSRRCILKRSHVEEVKCCTLAELVDKHNFYDFNLLQIDAEGLDFDIMKSIDFKKSKPDIIHYEHIFIDRSACALFLKKMGYKIISDIRDSTAYLCGL